MPPINYYELYRQSTQPSTQQRLDLSTIEPTSQPFYKPITSTVTSVLDWLGRPGAATAGFLTGLDEGTSSEDWYRAWERAQENLAGTRRDSFDDYLKERQGMDDSWLRHGLGFGMDMVVDPLNVLPVGLIAKGAKTVGKIPGVGKATSALSDFAKPVTQSLKQKFSFTGNLPEPLAGDFRIMMSRRSAAPVHTVKDMVDRYGKLSPADRKLVTEGVIAGGGKTEWMPHPTIPGEVIVDEAKTKLIDDMVTLTKSVNDDVFDAEVAKGLMKQVNYDPDYFVRDYTSKFDTGSGIQSARSRLSAKNPHARRAQTENYADLKEWGGELDIANAQLTREAGSKQRIIVTDFINDTLRKYGAPVNEAPPTWRVLKVPAELPLAKKMRARALPPEIADKLDEVILPRGEKTRLGAAYDKGMDWWRTFATVLRPGFHGTNFIGNTWNSYLGGMNPLALLRKNSGVDIGRYSAEQIDNALIDMGVLGSDFTRELGEKNYKGALQRALAAKQNPKGTLAKIKDRALHPIDTARAVGGGVEDFSKRAFFMDRLRKGDTLQEAALNTKKYLFDYSELTDFERKIRRFVPFYTWIRKNTPLQIESLINDPAKFAKASHAFNAMENAAEEHGVYMPDEYRPEFVQQVGGVQLPWATEEGGPAYYLPNLPINDLNKLPIPGGSSFENSFRDVLAALGPGLKAPAEIGFNQSLFTGRQLYDDSLGPFRDYQKRHTALDWLPDAVSHQIVDPYTGQLQPGMPVISNYLMQQIPVLNSGSKFLQGLGSAVLGPDESNFRSVDQGPAAITSFMTGLTAIPQTPYEANQAIKNALRRQTRQANKYAEQNPYGEETMQERMQRLWMELYGG